MGVHCRWKLLGHGWNGHHSINSLFFPSEWRALCRRGTLDQVKRKVLVYMHFRKSLSWKLSQYVPFKIDRKSYHGFTCHGELCVFLTEWKRPFVFILLSHPSLGAFLQNIGTPDLLSPTHFGTYVHYRHEHILFSEKHRLTKTSHGWRKIKILM